MPGTPKGVVKFIEQLSAWQARGKEKRVLCATDPRHGALEPIWRPKGDGTGRILLRCNHEGCGYACDNFPDHFFEPPPPEVVSEAGRNARDIAHC